MGRHNSSDDEKQKKKQQGPTIGNNTKEKKTESPKKEDTAEASPPAQMAPCPPPQKPSNSDTGLAAVLHKQDVFANLTSQLPSQPSAPKAAAAAAAASSIDVTQLLMQPQRLLPPTLASSLTPGAATVAPSVPTTHQPESKNDSLMAMLSGLGIVDTGGSSENNRQDSAAEAMQANRKMQTEGRVISARALEEALLADSSASLPYPPPPALTGLPSLAQPPGPSSAPPPGFRNLVLPNLGHPTSQLFPSLGLAAATSGGSPVTTPPNLSLTPLQPPLQTFFGGAGQQQQQQQQVPPPPAAADSSSSHPLDSLFQSPLFPGGLNLGPNLVSRK